MRIMNAALAAMLSLAAVSALAQAPSIAVDATGARPGHDPGVGESLPKSDKASNILDTAVGSTLAPTLPSPGLGDDASPADYLRAARAALVAGQTGKAQQALEMAETRSLDRAIAPGSTATASRRPMVGVIHDALHALGSGDTAGTIMLIDRALAG